MHRHGHFINALLGAAVVMTIAAFVFEPPSDKILRVVAFVGKSMQYVNDLPRFMQARAGISSLFGTAEASHIYRNSCLHEPLKCTTSGSQRMLSRMECSISAYAQSLNSSWGYDENFSFKNAKWLLPE